MSDRELVLEVARDLPEDVSRPEIMRQIEFLRGVKEAIAESDRGEVYSIEEVERRIAAWNTALS